MLLTLGLVYRSSTRRCTASAPFIICVERRLVVDCDLLTRLDVAKCDKENMAIEYFHVAVGFAAVVYVVRAVPAFAAVEAPPIINGTDTEPTSPGAAIGFCIGYSLSGVLSYLSFTEKLCI